MNRSFNRRTFLGASAVGVALSVSATRGDQPTAKDSLVVGVMGPGGRGTEHARLFAEQPGVTVAYVCDVDLKRANSAAEAVAKLGGKPPQAVQDFRRILDDKKVDILT